MTSEFYRKRWVSKIHASNHQLSVFFHFPCSKSSNFYFSSSRLLTFLLHSLEFPEHLKFRSIGCHGDLGACPQIRCSILHSLLCSKMPFYKIEDVLKLHQITLYLRHDFSPICRNDNNSIQGAQLKFMFYDCAQYSLGSFPLERCHFSNYIIIKKCKYA